MTLQAVTDKPARKRRLETSRFVPTIILIRASHDREYARSAVSSKDGVN